MSERLNMFLLRIIILFSLFGAYSASAVQGGGEDVLLRKTYSGNIDYVAVGGSFRDQPNGVNACSFVASPLTDTVSVDIPIGSTVIDAYLYFAGSKSDTIDLSDQTSLTLNGVALNTTAGFNEIDYPSIDDVLGITTIDFFGARRDVSNIVTGPGAYTFSGLIVNQAATNETCLGAWALVVIYEDPSITQIRVVNLFDGFQFYQNDTFDLEPRNFVVDNTSPAGKMTHISFEGDETLGTAGENFLFSDDNITFDELISPPENPLDNQYNGTVTGPGLFPSTTEYGLDVDTYEIDSLLTPGAFEAVTRYNTGQDLVILMSEVIQVDNLPLADLEVTLNDVGVFTTNTDDSAQFIVSVQNNGDGVPGSVQAFAEGNVFVYFDLETGIDIDNLGEITAPGWDCSATDFVDNEVRCFYDLSTLSGGNLDAGESLPDIIITVDVATPASPITSIVRMTNCEAAQGTSFPDSCVTFAGKHEFVDQFDPVNFFEEFEVNIFSVDAKSDINNNVDAEITPIVTGNPSNLSTSIKEVIAAPSPLQVNDTVTYRITVNETGGEDANDIIITDIIDTDTTGFSLPLSNNTCAGSSEDYTGGVLTVDGFNLTANSSCSFEFTVTIPVTASAGTAIDNAAAIASSTGIGANVSAPTLLVSGTATGSKILYFDQLSTTRILTREAPSIDSTFVLNAGNTLDLDLNPVLAADLDINAGIIPVSVWVEANTTGTYQIDVDLTYPGVQSITGDSLAGVNLTAGSPQLLPFQLDLASNITDFDVSEALTLSITNDAGSAGSVDIRALNNNIDSKVIIDAETVINVDDIRFFTDVGRTNEIVSPGTFEAGTTVYIEATISDPFGDQDITSATLTLIDPNLANQLTNVSMTSLGENGDAIKLFTYAYDIPDAASIPVGVWVAQVTGNEGDEGTVTHTEADSFETAAPEVNVTYTVDNTLGSKTLTASAGETLEYTITINNTGAGPVTTGIDQAIPALTENLVFTSALPAGTTNSSTSTQIDLSFDAPAGITVITFTVDVQNIANPGDLIDDTVFLTVITPTPSDIAPSVLIDPFGFNTGNKPIYGDAFNTVRRFDRTIPTSNTTVDISSQGGNRTFTLSPVLQGDLDLATGDINVSVWINRGASFAGQRVIEATLGYTGAANGTIGVADTVTIQLADSSPQYIPFSFNLASPLTLPANTSLTLTLTNNTTVTGETITVNTFLSGDSPSDVPTLVSLNVTDPLEIVALEFFTDSVDTVNPGTPITETQPSTNVWVRATVSDPFGRDDITDARLRIEDPNDLETLASTSMNVPTAQPASTAQKYYELQHSLSAELGDWEAFVEADEGDEGIVTANASALLNVNNNIPDLTDSFKYVVNTTTGDNANTNPGDNLHYTIELVNTGLASATNVTFNDAIPANTTFVASSLLIDSVAQPDPGDPINLNPLTVPAGGTLVIEFDVTVDGGTPVSTIISNTANITNPSGLVTNIDVESEDLVIAGAPAAGTKLLYLEDLDTVSPFLTRLEPQVDGDTDRVELQNAGGSVTMDLTPALAKDITLDPADDIVVTLRMEGLGANNRNRNVQVDLGYQNGGAVTSLGTLAQNANLFTGTVTTHIFTIPVNAITTIPAGNQIQLTITNNQGNNNRDLYVYSFDNGGSRSSVALVPTPVINVDSVTFWTDTMGAGTQITNPNPTSNTDIYAKIVISDPFGEADIQAFDAATNPSTISMTSPDGAVPAGASAACAAPCYFYDGEDITNDVDAATRTFYYLIRLDAAPPATRGTWTVQVTANEGLEGDVFHTDVGNFTTALAANLSTSTKEHDVVGDVSNGTNFTYTITLNNTGALDADNVEFTDTLQTSPVALSFVSASTTCLDETDSPLPDPGFSGGDVTLNNISVDAGSSCTITITVSAGAGTPGQLIDNSATIINPGGTGGTPAAPTILFEESQIPVAGSKQLYLDLTGATDNTPTTGALTRDQSSLAVDSVILDEDPGDDDITLQLDNVTVRDATLGIGTIDVKLLLSETGNGRNRQTEVELLVDSDANGSFETNIGSQQLNLSLDGTASLRTISLVNASEIPLAAGADFQLIIRNNQNQNNRKVILHQATSAPFSELVVPLINPIEVTDLTYWDRSATDDSAGPAGCAATFSCGTELTDDPLFIISTGNVWVRATAADAFGSSDVNTGSEVCDGVTSDNCPTITVTNPSAGATTSDLVFVHAPDVTSRQYEFQVVPSGPFLDGTWQVEVEFEEGVENLIFDTRIATFERYSPAVLTVVKSVSGDTDPGSILTYDNNVTNTAVGDAINVSLTNIIGDFTVLQLLDNGGTWTAQFSITGGYTIANETFDSGDDSFTYDPNVTGVCVGQPSPCYDPAITQWRVELNENVPGGTNFIQQYRTQIEGGLTP